MAISSAAGVWLCGAPELGVVEELIRKHVSLPVWTLIDVFARAKPAAVFVRCSTEDDQVRYRTDVLHAFALEAAKALKVPVYEFEELAGASDDLLVRAIDARGKTRWEERSEDDAAYWRFAKEVRAGKARLLSVALKPALEVEGPGWRTLGTVELAAPQPGTARKDRQIAAAANAILKRRKAREPSLLAELTAALEEALVTADARVPPLRRRAYEGAVRVRGRIDSMIAADALPPQHPAAVVVKGGGLLADLQLYLEDEQGGPERKLTGVVGLAVDPGSLEPVDEAAVAAALDATVHSLLTAS